MVAPLNDDSINPLLKPSNLPYGAPPLSEVKAEHFMPALNEAIKEAKTKIEAIKFSNSRPSFQNTIEALEFSGQKMGRVAGIFRNLAGVISSEALRDMEAEFETALVKHGNDVMMDERLFARVEAVYDMRATLKLTDEQKMLLEETYKRFVRAGAKLDVDKKAELSKIKERLAVLSADYSNNVFESTKEYKKVISDEKDLAGVPERAKNSYRKAAEEAGMPDKWVILLSPPPLDILSYAENRALRQDIHRAMNSVAYGDKYDNCDIITETVQLRHAHANLLGYPTHAAFVLEDRIAKTPQNVMNFLENNAKVYRPSAEAFLQQLKDYACKTDGIKDLKPWDIPFYWRKLQEETFQLDMEQLRPYFSLEKVLDGLRIHAEKLFGIKMTEIKGKYPVYHPDVKVYEVHDIKSGEMKGLIYDDYEAREEEKKSGSGWMNVFRERGIEDGKNMPPIVIIVCNFEKPTKDQPSLLSIAQLYTTIHEYGHAWQSLLAEGNYQSLTGTNVKWDFLEVASQLMENWVEEKEVLDSFAVHYKTGEKLPDPLIQKIKDIKNFGAGYAGLRETFWSALDMAWHTGDPAAIKSLENLEDDVIAQYWLHPREPGDAISTNYEHIFTGSFSTSYSVGYHVYDFAAVSEAHIFEVFKEKGLYDQPTAARLRDTIYSKGGTVDPTELFRRLMGHDPDPNAVFRRKGLMPPRNNANKQPDCTKPPKPPC